MAFSSLEKVALVQISIVSLVVLRQLFRFVYENFIGPNVNKVDYKSKGQWALVTGSTDGVGKEYARALAAKGCDIVLVSRSLEKLKDVAQEIEKEYKVSTRVIKADFTEDEKIYEVISKELEGLEIGTLVNNVGISYPHPDYFLELDDSMKVYERILKANVIATTRMCSIVMPGMVKRGRGVVINISSTAALIPSPLLTIYAASKAFVDKFSEDLDSEYSKRGIIVQCVLPGYVATKMSKMTKTTWMAPSPKDFVASALQSVGTKSKTTGYVPHSLLVFTVNCFKTISPAFAVWMITRTMENIKRRALRKYNATKDKSI